MARWDTAYVFLESRCVCMTSCRCHILGFILMAKLFGPKIHRLHILACNAASGHEC